jgi:O-6-methylguanine DNA methyltransferase
MIALMHIMGGAALAAPSSKERRAPGAWVCFAASDDGIAACTLPKHNPADALAEVDQSLGAAARGDSLLPRVGAALRRYFAGERAEFDFPLDLSRVSPFARRVLRAVAQIPYGETRSYREIARRAGSPGAARAVGRVMARNPLPPIVPCHRVIGSNWRLVGFAGGLGLKRRLLQMEGARAAQAKP